MPHIAVNVNVRIDIDVEQVSEYRRLIAKNLGDHVTLATPSFLKTMGSCTDSPWKHARKI